jgi:hypothetical protein
MAKKLRKHTGVECRMCGDRIFSEYTHDFKYCKCGETFVDGGYSYMRYGGNIMPNYVERDENGNETIIERKED